MLKIIEINADALPPKGYICIRWDNDFKQIAIRVDQLDEFLAAYILTETVKEEAGND